MKLSKFSLLGAFMLLAGCSDDLDFHPAKTGENIQFGTKAYFANADTKSSRTEYGNVSADKKAIELKWVKGDKILIACPQVSQPVSGAVEYQVNEQHAITDGSYTEKDVATSLSPTSMPGLQWGDVTKAHNFYGIYPSANDVNKFKLDEVTADGTHTTFTGVLPQSQDPKEIVPTTDGYVAKPNMDYAYMVAQTTNKVDKEGVVSKDVVLTFEPIVTALQFDIIAQKVSNEGSDVTINSINLYSQNKNISGEFTCNFGTTKSVTVSNEKGAKNVNMFFKNGVKLKANQHFNFTFFFLSNGTEALTDMKVTFNYTTNNVVKTKTATIGKDISAKVKHYFKGIEFKAIEGEKAEGSNWFSHVEDAAYLDQLSIPVAGNPFSYQSTTNKQQEKDYVSLWNLGVRGFELPTDRAGGDTTSLDTKRFVVGESEVKTTLTLGGALTKLKELQGLTGSEKEPLILVFRYYPVSVKYNPREYLKQVVQTLKNARLFDKLVKVDNQSTAYDLKGKVVAFVRLGDDAYIRMARIENQFTDFTSCNDLVPTGFEMGNIMFIKDWGNAYDCWDRRYPNVERQSNWTETYSRNIPSGVYSDYSIGDHAAGHIYKGSGFAAGDTYQIKKEGISCIEDLLCGVSSNNQTYTSVDGYLNFGQEPDRLTDHNLMFKHEIYGGGSAYVQEWSRVISANHQMATGDRGMTKSSNNNYWLFVNWWKSIDQKMEQIDKLFEEAVKNTHADLFVNVLSGYYAVDTDITSFTPCKRWIDVPGKNVTVDFVIAPSGQGKGGDFSALARDLNTYVYNKLRTDAYGIGPWGFIQLDYIGATTFSTNYQDKYSVADAVNASANIVPLIVANNFRFIKNTKRETVNAPVVSNGPADMTIGMQ